MAQLKMKEIRDMTPVLREDKLREVRDELMHERGIGAMGGAPASPGKIKALRKNIARLLTVQREVTLASLNNDKKKAPSSRKSTSEKGGAKGSDATKKKETITAPAKKKKEAKQ
ncbi:MAG: 50S ribosomal protein L29 [Thermoplasmata archaeon]|nr:50S ribosomal protein L29 [Thermoplasmata archaeon]